MAFWPRIKKTAFIVYIQSLLFPSNINPKNAFFMIYSKKQFSTYFKFKFKHATV